MSKRRVVITGVGAVSPMGPDAAALWKGLREGRSAVRSCPSLQEMRGLRTTIAAYVDGIDAGRIERKKRRYMSNMSIYLTLAAQEAVRQAALEPEQIRSERTGVCAGSTTGSTIETEKFFTEMIKERSVDQLKSTHFFKIMNSSCAANLAQALGISGRVLSPSAACATGTIAVGLGAECIASDKQDVMICGGADELHPLTVSVFDTLEASSRLYNDRPDQSPRPFDRDRDGIVCGEGGGIVVLESFEHARARRAPILGEIHGFGINNSPDAIANPMVDAMVHCMGAALDESTYSPDQVGYVNAHATGTLLGDQAECRAIEQVFGCNVPVSSLKGHMGHTMAACGALELIATLDMMQEGMLIPTRNLENTGEGCMGLNLLKTFEQDSVEVAVINSFALGGVNSALVISRRSINDG